MLDRDLAELYVTETGALNQAVKRNLVRFPQDFMFQLPRTEWEQLRAELLMREKSNPSRSQFVTLKTTRGHNLKYLPYVFTEQGVAMLSSVLHSSRAVQMNIAIMRAFVEMRRLAMEHDNLKMYLDQIRERVREHNTQLKAIYDALENLLDEKAAQRKWEERPRIGFKR
jgi:hypothetical protein